MIRTDPQRDSVESFTTDTRYRGFGTEDGYIVYDTEKTAAWVQSDTTRPLEEMV